MSYHQKSCIYFCSRFREMYFENIPRPLSQNVIFYNSTVSRISNTEVAGKLVILFSRINITHILIVSQ